MPRRRGLHLRELLQACHVFDVKVHCCSDVGETLGELLAGHALQDGELLGGHAALARRARIRPFVFAVSCWSSKAHRE